MKITNEDWLNMVLPKMSEDQLNSALETIVENANKECEELARQDPLEQ